MIQSVYHISKLQETNTMYKTSSNGQITWSHEILSPSLILHMVDRCYQVVSNLSARFLILGAGLCRLFTTKYTKPAKLVVEIGSKKVIKSVILL